MQGKHPNKDKPSCFATWANTCSYSHSLHVLSFLITPLKGPYQLPWRLCSAGQAQALWIIHIRARTCLFKHFQILYFICQKILIPCHSFCSRLGISPQVGKHLLHLLGTLHQDIGDLIIIVLRLRTILGLRLNMTIVEMGMIIHDYFTVQMFSYLTAFVFQL